MGMLLNKSRLSWLAAIAATFVSATALGADNQVSDHVIVEADRPTAKVVGRSATGAAIEQVELRARVTYTDLDLSIPNNAKVLKQRVQDAAREICDRLEQMYPLGGGGDRCVYDAVEGAQSQVAAALSSAEARKSASAQ